MLSYLQWGFLWLRAVLILAAIVFIVWSTAVLKYSLDGVIWNIVFIIVHCILSIPLIMAMLPVRLSKEHLWIYNQYFKSFFKKKQFKWIMNYATKNVYKNAGPICEAGTPLSFYYLFYSIPEGAKVEVVKNGKVVGQVKQGQWVGVIDAWVNLEKGDDIEEMTWSISCKVTQSSLDAPVKALAFSA